jgi:tRNA-modifying protein YgfZ
MATGPKGYVEANEAAAIAALPDRGVIQATGPDRQKFLQAMLSNEVLALKPGEGCASAFMDVKGHVQALLRVSVVPNAVHLEVPRERLSQVQTTLDHFKVAAPVRFQARDLSVIAILGPGAEAVLKEAGGEPPSEAPEAHHETAAGGRSVRVIRARDLPVAGLILHASSEDAEAVLGALVSAGATSLEPAALDALRVEAGRPWFGRDVTEDNLLHETGLVAELCSFRKGCYLGQEVIARLDARGGHVNKRLRGLRLSAPAHDGAPVTAAGDAAGRVTTAALSPRLGPIALAYVHRAHAEAGAVVEVEGSRATVVELPFPPGLARTA